MGLLFFPLHRGSFCNQVFLCRYQAIQRGGQDNVEGYLLYPPPLNKCFRMKIRFWLLIPKLELEELRDKILSLASSTCTTEKQYRQLSSLMQSLEEQSRRFDRKLQKKISKKKKILFLPLSP
eukprot:TRINITY_DN2585_c0_g1_i4.p1 TRINITY_DN2585_c0_g1~~TRINITY_DN2585_c0_g1_i4.p1  ORF type:complete len:122 (+),score=30.07 TRINITY_DN2585_c0_g1_i4:416-781(+)